MFFLDDGGVTDGSDGCLYMGLVVYWDEVEGGVERYIAGSLDGHSLKVCWSPSDHVFL